LNSDELLLSLPIFLHRLGEEMGWRREAIEILKRGVEKFPSDTELKTFLKDIEDGFDNDPLHGGKLLGLMLLIAVIQKKLRKK
jgi:hypothetical protein